MICLRRFAATIVGFQLLVGMVGAETIYIGPNSVAGNCVGDGRKINPYNSVNCIKDVTTVDEVLYLPGKYNFQKPEVYRFNSSSPVPVIVRSERGRDSVNISGIVFISSKNLIVKDLSFNSPTYSKTENFSDGGIINIGKSNYIKLLNIRVEGDYSNWSDSLSNVAGFKRDCIKIAGGQDSGDSFVIGNSIIKNCAEDAIDVTGRTKIYIINNEISRSFQVQIKGGAEDIIFQGNRFSDMRNGIASGGMDCIKLKTYCGSWEQLKLPLQERYQAKRLIARNNYFYGISANAFSIAGWVDSYIYANKFYGLQGLAILSQRDVGSFFWNSVEKYDLDRWCVDNNDCLDSLIGVYHKVRTKVHNLFFYENYFFDAKHFGKFMLAHDVSYNLTKGYPSWCINNNSVDNESSIKKLGYEAFSKISKLAGGYSSSNFSESELCSKFMKEIDSDLDGVFDYKDNCPLIKNSNQEDKNLNGVGDICENKTGSLSESVLNFPSAAPATINTLGVY